MKPSLLADTPTGLFVAMGIAILIVFLGVVFFIRYVSLWLQASMARAPIPLASLIGMSLRRVDLRAIVRARIMAVQGGLDDMTTDVLETHHLAGGNVDHVVLAMLAAQRAGIRLDFDKAAGIDLAGRDVVEAVRACVTPRVLDCPNPDKGDPAIRVRAKDDVPLRIKASVTVRANLDRLVGGATEQTLIDRVAEAIVTGVRSARDHQEALDHPEAISEQVLARGLDAGTAFDILSIDIVDIRVGL